MTDGLAPRSEAASPLPLVSSEDVVARLSLDVTEDAEVGDALAFDADGTLWSGDIGIDTFEALLVDRAVRSEALGALLAEAAEYGVPASGDATDVARALHDALERGTYPESRAFPMMAWIFAGFSEPDVRSFAEKVIERVSLAERLHQEVLPIVHWATERSIPLLVISASATLVVRTAVERLGIRASRVVGMSAAIEHGVIAPRLEGTATYGAGKVVALREAAGRRTVLGAFGDSAYDLPMLAEARVAVAVRPKPELRAQSGACPGLIELASRIP